MDPLDWLDEADGRMTRAIIGWPAIEPQLRGITKHLKYTLNHPQEVIDLRIAAKHIKGMMTAAMVQYPELEEHFRPVIEKWE